MSKQVITPENCHLIKQTVCGIDIDLIGFSPTAKHNSGYTIIAVLGSSWYYFNELGKALFDKGAILTPEEKERVNLLLSQ